MGSKHDEVAQMLAQRYGTEYNRAKGPDVQASHITIEVESAGTIADAGRQLQGHRGPVYVAGTNQRATEAALERYRGTTIGVMDEHGSILKPSTRNS
jgi:hypothetical protein